jgi:hypothetical protein
MKFTLKSTLVNSSREVFYNQKFVILLWATNSVLALLMTIPVANMLRDNLQTSLMSDKLALGFDFIWYVQFTEIYKRGISQLPNLLYGITTIYVLINTFYAGGLIAVFSNSKKNHIIDFFYGGIKHWFRFMKVVLLSVVLYAAAFILNTLFGQLIASVFSGTEMSALDFTLRVIRYAFLIFMIGIVSIVSDYTKVIMALRNRQNLFKTIGYSALFIKNNFNKSFGLFFIVALMGGLGTILYNIIDLGIPRTPYYFLLLSFILQQILVIFRLNIRMLFYSTEVLVFKDLDADMIEPVDFEEAE